ncbi:MAG: cell wall metabolism sensor histidine kinase WalK, partial [Candidatus Omnitrophica bacterium]|nr:cell wall metabolism sensor histidine kinase WalK [Candidatus Omnitrophota bacterium]
MRIKIHYKLTLIFIAIITVVLAVNFLYLNNKLKNHILTRTKDNLKKQTQLAKITIKKNFSLDDQLYSIDKLVDKIGKSLDLRTTVINRAGVVLGDSELDGKDLKEVENHLMRPEVQEALVKGEGLSKRFSKTIGKDLIYYALPLEKEKTIAIVRLSIPLSEVEMISGKLKEILFFSFIGVFLLASGVSFLAALFITRPIKEISWVAKGVANGNLDRRVSVNSLDEIGDLAEAFNFMLDQIKLKIEEVTASRSRLKAVLLSMFDGVMVTDKKGDIILVNNTLKKELKIKQDPEGKLSLEVIRNLEIQKAIEEILEKKSGIFSKEITITELTKKTFILHAAPVLKGGRPDGAVLIFHDITELRRLEHVRKDFIANVSHELRTPVTNIQGYAETLLAGAWQDEKDLKEFLNIIYSDTEKLAHLINDILDLSKIESTDKPLKLELVNLNDLILKVVKNINKKADKKEIKLQKNLDKNISKLSVDKMQIEQALLNIIDNAIKYTLKQGKINISTTQLKDKVRIDISDTGIGIPEKDLKRIFERFYRVDKARSHKLGGTGLGLSIVKNIILNHNGKIWCKSIEGAGSTFSFTLP